MTTVTVQALQKLWWKSWEGTPEEESLEATSENRHRGCGRDMLGQTVPSTGSSNREGPITDGGQPCTTNIQRQWGSRSKASQNQPCIRAHRRDTTLLSRAARHLYIQEQRAWTESSLMLSVSAICYTNTVCTKSGHLCFFASFITQQCRLFT